MGRSTRNPWTKKLISQIKYKVWITRAVDQMIWKSIGTTSKVSVASKTSMTQQMGWGLDQLTSPNHRINVPISEIFTRFPDHRCIIKTTINNLLQYCWPLVNNVKKAGYYVRWFYLYTYSLALLFFLTSYDCLPLFYTCLLFWSTLKWFNILNLT